MATLTEVVRLINSGKYREALEALSNKELLNKFLKNVKNAKNILKHLLINVIIKHKEIPENNPIYKMFENDPYVRKAVMYVSLEKARRVVDRYAESKDVVDVVRYLVENYRKFGRYGDQLLFYALARFIEATKNNPDYLISVLNTFKMMFDQLGVSLPPSVKALVELGYKVYNIKEHREEVSEKVAKEIVEKLENRIKEVMGKYKQNLAMGLSSPEFVSALELLGVPKAVIKQAQVLAETGIRQGVEELVHLVNSLKGANIEALADSWNRIYNTAETLLHKLEIYKNKLGDYYNKYKNIVIEAVKTVGEPLYYYYLKKHELDKARNILNSLSRVGVNTAPYVGMLRIIEKIYRKGISPEEALKIIREVR